MATLPNIWHLRKVAEASAKPCDICYKPTNSVLITPDNKDFFYLCLGHLKDRSFASPVVDEAEIAAKRRKEEMEREIEKVKIEYEEKMKKKSKEKKGKEEKKEKEKGKDVSKDNEDEAKAEKEKSDKINAITNKNIAPATEDIPRIYNLQKVFFQKRLDRLRNAETAKRNRERLKNPSTFPSVPTKDLG